MNEKENTENVSEDITDLPWKEQPRVLSRLLIGVAALIGGITWSIFEQNTESQWVVWGFFPAPWFLIIGGAIAIIGEIIKKPNK